MQGRPQERPQERRDVPLHPDRNNAPAKALQLGSGLADDCDVELDVRCDKLERSYTDREIASKPAAVYELALRWSGTGREWCNRVGYDDVVDEEVFIKMNRINTLC
jgi:hypothetical protein